jgi:hypothetical protein
MGFRLSPLLLVSAWWLRHDTEAMLYVLLYRSTSSIDCVPDLYHWLFALDIAIDLYPKLQNCTSPLCFQKPNVLPLLGCSWQHSTMQLIV